MKSHFTFTKNQRNGIFLLLFVIVILQSVCFFIDFTSENINVNEKQWEKFEREIDVLRLAKTSKKEPITKPFNPNYIDDFKGDILGMNTEEINRLLAFRKQDKWINSAEEFQKVTQISDSLLQAISPYFKFPEWVNLKVENKKRNVSNLNTPKVYLEKGDLNTVSAEDLQTIKGIGNVLSNRIIKYRNTFSGGFTSNIELEDVYGLSPEVIEKINNKFVVKTPRHVEKINLNSATVNELVTIPHIDYDLAYQIVEQRVLRDGYKSLDELLKVKGFPVNKIKIIQLYLQFEKK